MSNLVLARWNCQTAVQSIEECPHALGGKIDHSKILHTLEKNAEPEQCYFSPCSVKIDFSSRPLVAHVNDHSTHIWGAKFSSSTSAWFDVSEIPPARLLIIDSQEPFTKWFWAWKFNFHFSLFFPYLPATSSQQQSSLNCVLNLRRTVVHAYLSLSCLITSKCQQNGHERV